MTPTEKSSNELQELKSPKIILIVQSAIPNVRHSLGYLEDLFMEWSKTPNDLDDGDDFVEHFVNFLNQKAIEKDVETLTKVKE